MSGKIVLIQLLKIQKQKRLAKKNYKASFLLGIISVFLLFMR